jgi:Flp pilus assembly pilin Flp
MKRFFKQIGQGMTEYIIIVALVAIAAIGAYTFFGDAVKQTLGVVAEELTGTDSAAVKSTSDARVTTTLDMGDFTESDKK